MELLHGAKDAERHENQNIVFFSQAHVTIFLLKGQPCM